MKKNFNQVIIISILLLLFSAVAGQHYFDKMQGPILAMKQLEMTGAIQQNLTILNDSYNISFWVISTSQVISILILLFVLYNNIEQRKTLITQELKISDAENNLKSNQKDLEEAYQKLEVAQKITERNSKFLELIQQSDSLEKLSQNILNELSKELNASQAAFFKHDVLNEREGVRIIASYAYHIPDSKTVFFELGEGLVGQVAVDGKIVNLKEIPEGHIEIISGLGSSQKANLILIPIKSENKVISVIEIASFEPFQKEDIDFLERLAENISTKLSVLIA